jgi:hypothetical protein
MRVNDSFTDLTTFKFINCIISSKLRSLIFIMIKVNKLVCDFSATLSQFWIYIWSVQSRKVPICSFKFFCFETKKNIFCSFKSCVRKSWLRLSTKIFFETKKCIGDWSSKTPMEILFFHRTINKDMRKIYHFISCNNC